MSRVTKTVLHPATTEDDHANAAGLSSRQLLELASALVAKRAEVLQRSESRRAHDEQRIEVYDEADLACAHAERRLRARLGEHDAILLREVERALAKLREGSYGICEATGEPIGYARLAARPWSLYRIRSQTAREFRPRSHPARPDWPRHPSAAGHPARPLPEASWRLDMPFTGVSCPPRRGPGRGAR